MTFGRRAPGGDGGEAGCGAGIQRRSRPLHLHLQMPAHSLEALAALDALEILIKHV